MNNNKYWIFLVVILSFSVSQPSSFAAPAGDSDEPLTIVITGSSIPAEESQDILSTYVIKKEDIEKHQPRSVSQLLQLVPGLHVENAASRGTLNAVYLRGAESNYTLVLIDGIKVNDPTNSRGGAYDFSLLDINSVERIEVVKGAFSSVYGSDAMAGVINIITKPSIDDLKTTARVEAGSRGLKNAKVTAGNRFDDGYMAMNVVYADDGEQVEGSQFVATSLNANGDYDIDNATKVSFSAFYQDSEAEAFPEASGGDEYAVLRELDETDTTQQQYSLSVAHQQSPSNTIKIQLSHFRNEATFDSAGVAGAIPANNSDTDYHRNNILLSSALKSIDDMDVSIGAEIEQEDGDSDAIIDPGGFNLPADFQLDRDLYAMFGELHYRISNKLFLLAGLRIDVPDDFDNELSPRISFKYSQNTTSYRASWGEGFKLPSFFALAHPIVGNPDFEPETSRGYEIGVQQNINPATNFDLAIFQQTYFDLIDFDDSGVLVQRSEVTTQGVELNFSHNFSEMISLHAQYTALDFDIKDSSDELHKRPERLAGLTITWEALPRVVFSARASYIGEVKDFAYPTGERTLDSYTKLDVTLNWQWNDRWRSQFAVDNLLDESYEEAIGFKAPGIGARFALEGSF